MTIIAENTALRTARKLKDEKFTAQNRADQENSKQEVLAMTPITPA
jgi:hypothetical protein